MKQVEIFLTLSVPHTVHAKFEDCIIPDIKNGSMIENVIVVAENSDGETDLSFSFDADIPIVEEIIKQLKQAEIKILNSYIHFSSSISGVSDVYDARDKGGMIRNALSSIDGIKEATIASNGTVRIETNLLTNQDILISEVLRSLKSLQNNNSQ